MQRCKHKQQPSIIVKSPTPQFHLLACSFSVVPLITIPVSMLAGLYTANKITVHKLLGLRLGILTEVVSELRFFVYVLTYLFSRYSEDDIVFIRHMCFSWYLSGKKVG